MDPITVIAEAAQGYEGKPLLAELLIRSAAHAGADAVKFQIVFADDVAVPGYRYYPWYKQLEMPESAWMRLKALAHECGLRFYADISGERALALALRLKPDGVKVHSANFYNHALAAQLIANFPRLLVSMGGIAVEEAERFIARHDLKAGTGQVAFLFGFQAEPTPIEQNALSRLPGLVRRLVGFQVGFMDHSDGGGPDVVHLSAMALALGVRLFEKHITLDRSLRLEDYASAASPDVFKTYVDALRRLEPALGCSDLALSDAEKDYRRRMVKKLIAARSLDAGQVLAVEDFLQKRLDAQGNEFCYDPKEVVGRRLVRALAAGEPLKPEHFA
jgi:N,N'-diacetyllegionaminate synthase